MSKATFHAVRIPSEVDTPDEPNGVIVVTMSLTYEEAKDFDAQYGKLLFTDSSKYMPLELHDFVEELQSGIAEIDAKHEESAS